MDRKVAGVLALVLAVVALVSVPRLISPGLAGTPSAAPMPAPPAIGSCVVEHPMRLVDCSQPHQGEISARWTAEDPNRNLEATPDHCVEKNADYIDAQESTELLGWTVATPGWRTRVARAPADQRVDNYGWNACVLLAPSSGLYLGSVRGLGDLTERPDIFGACQNDRYAPAPCTQPHRTEVLAVTDGVWYDAESGLGPGDRTSEIRDLLDDVCRAVAEELTGSADPTYAGRLAVEVVVEVERQQKVTYTEIRYATSYFAICQVSAVDRALLGSVVGLGDALPPLG